MKSRYNYKTPLIPVMKYLLFTVLLSVASPSVAVVKQQILPRQTNLPGQDKSRAAERIYIATDRDVYVAGESMWLSVYCIDINNSLNLSGISSIAYLELYNAQSLVLTAKVVLVEGRGSGHIELPPNLPTGNYKIISYTKQMLNELEPVFFEKVIPIYNVLSSDRVVGNVVAGAAKVENETSLSLSNLWEQDIVEVNFGASGRTIPTQSSFSFSLNNKGESILLANISVYKRDSLSNNHNKNFVSYLSSLPNSTPSFVNNFIPEYEGEIISWKSYL